MIVVTRSRQFKGDFLLLIHCRLITNELMHCLVSVVWATTFFPRHPGTPAPGLRRKGLRSQVPAAREKARPKRGGRGKALKGCDTPLPGHGPYGAAAAAGAAPPCPRTGGGKRNWLTSFFLRWPCPCATSAGAQGQAQHAKGPPKQHAPACLGPAQVSGRSSDARVLSVACIALKWGTCVKPRETPPGAGVIW